MPKQRQIDGMNNVTQLRSKAVIQNAGTYLASDVLGYRVLTPGTGNWSVKFKNGIFVTIPFGAMIAGQVYDEHIDNITVGTGGSALLYIPAGD